MTISIGSDHAGFETKKKVIEWLIKEKRGTILDLGCDSELSVDYPDYAMKVSHSVKEKGGLGIMICGSGIGVAISANKELGIRAATCWDYTSARLARAHNDANIICLGARVIGLEVIFDSIDIFLKTPFLKGRHEQRIKKMMEQEKQG